MSDKLMKWTTKKPTRDGWYWVRSPNFTSPQVVDVVVAANAYHLWGEVGALTESDVEWSDQPIPEPHHE